MKPVDKKIIKNIAKERICALFEKAESIKNSNIGLSNRYITLIRKIAMKSNVSIPIKIKRRICKHCYKFLIPGQNCRIRSKDGKMIYYCLNCKKFTRIPYKNNNLKNNNQKKSE